MTALPPFPVSKQPTASEVADWCECAALLTGVDFKRGDLKSAISREDVTAPELLEEQAWSELQHRAKLLGDRWPLEMSDTRLTSRNWTTDHTLIYQYLCLIALGDIDAEDRILFEQIVECIVASRIGSTVDRIGHPARGGASSSFRERAAQYAEKSHLRELEFLSEPLPHDKDLGLDVVGWLPSADGRGGYLHFLFQCATGKNWDEKLHDIDLDLIAPHIKWAVTPVRVFCIPVIVNLPHAQWIRLSMQAGWVMDRPRLLEISVGLTLRAEVRDNIAARTLELCA